jgi:hypothetical protein
MGRGMLQDSNYQDRADRPNCHILTHPLRTLGNAPFAFMPAAKRSCCMINAGDLGMLALVFGLCRWTAKTFKRLTSQKGTM